MMAIVNRTPDSFYDRGATFTDAAAMDRVDAAVVEGADIIDIGGVKAGPGAEVDLAEEIRRVVPFVAAVRARHPGVVISVDTWRGPWSARAAVAEGADLLNDTWAGRRSRAGCGRRRVRRRHRLLAHGRGGAGAGASAPGALTSTWSPT